MCVCVRARICAREIDMEIPHHLVFELGPPVLFVTKLLCFNIKIYIYMTKLDNSKYLNMVIVWDLVCVYVYTCMFLFVLKMFLCIYEFYICVCVHACMYANL